MRHFLFAAALTCLPALAIAQADDHVITDTVEQHILPRFKTLADTSQTLAATAQTDCAASSAPLRAAYSDAFDAWVAASHLRFGPTEVEDRAFALAFWPDSRGATPKSLSALIQAQDPIALDAQEYSQVTIAARGFYALEFLLYDDDLNTAGDAAYHCTLVKTVTADIAATSAAILQDWQTDYAERMLDADTSDTYRSKDEVRQELFKSLTAGLQFTAETRLGRPLGTYDRPRATRAEARRAGRSERHVILSLQSTKDMAIHLAGSDTALAQRAAHEFDTALAQLAELDDPDFSGVDTPASRLKLEVIQQSVEAIRTLALQEIGPKLGVASGFNALDGD